MPFSDKDLTPIAKQICNLSASIINDIFNWSLKEVTPIMKYENGKFIGDWKISNLFEAMYFELYIAFSQDVLIKKCPCCGAYFEISKTNSRKIYCSDICNDRMAQRRRREKQKKSEKERD